jgi:hypothetical protein
MIRHVTQYDPILAVIRLDIVIVVTSNVLRRLTIPGYLNPVGYYIALRKHAHLEFVRSSKVLHELFVLSPSFHLKVQILAQLTQQYAEDSSCDLGIRV